MDWLTIDRRQARGTAATSSTCNEPWSSPPANGAGSNATAGYLPLTIDEGFDGADPELFAAFAVIALHRARQDRHPRGPRRVRTARRTRPFGAAIRLESATRRPSAEANPPQPSSNANARHFWARFDRRVRRARTRPRQPTGTPASATSAFAPTRLASMTPMQLLGCVDLFDRHAWHRRLTCPSPSAGWRELTRTFKHARQGRQARATATSYRTIAEPVRTTCGSPRGLEHPP